jgi:hypothetical protein
MYTETFTREVAAESGHTLQMRVGGFGYEYRELLGGEGLAVTLGLGKHT